MSPPLDGGAGSDATIASRLTGDRVVPVVGIPGGRVRIEAVQFFVTLQLTVRTSRLVAVLIAAGIGVA